VDTSGGIARKIWNFDSIATKVLDNENDQRLSLNMEVGMRHQVCLIVVLGVLLTLFGCSGNPSNPSTSVGSLKFSFTSSQREICSAIVYSVENAQGDLIVSSQTIPLYSIGDQYMTSAIQFNVGSYRLTEFYVVNDSNQVVLAAPVQNSELAQLVVTPLPISFTVSDDETTNIAPEVLSTDLGGAVAFGYSSFTFDVVPTFRFLAAVSTDSTDFEFTDAEMTITCDVTHSIDLELAASINSIVVWDSMSVYHVLVQKEGYESVAADLSASQLAAYESAPWIIRLTPVMTPDVVAAWMCNGNGQDNGPNGLNAECIGASACVNRFGEAGQALHFNGNDLLWNDENPLLEPNYFSMAVWVKFDVLDTSCFMGIFDKEDTWNEGFGLRFMSQWPESDPHGKTIEYVVSGPTDDQRVALFSHHKFKSADEWRFIVGTYGADHVMRLYIDGQLDVATNGPSSWDKLGSQELVMGNHYDEGVPHPSGQGLIGSLDDIRFFDHAISAEEVSALYHEGGW
jgi:hypothetical protein